MANFYLTKKWSFVLNANLKLSPFFSPDFLSLAGMWVLQFGQQNPQNVEEEQQIHLENKVIYFISRKLSPENIFVTLNPPAALQGRINKKEKQETKWSLNWIILFSPKN